MIVTVQHSLGAALGDWYPSDNQVWGAYPFTDPSDFRDWAVTTRGYQVSSYFGQGYPGFNPTAGVTAPAGKQIGLEVWANSGTQATVAPIAWFALSELTGRTFAQIFNALPKPSGAPVLSLPNLFTNPMAPPANFTVYTAPAPAQQPPAAPTAQPTATVKLSNLTRPGSSGFYVGEQFLLEVHGPASQPVADTAVHDGASSTTIHGQTDGAGNWSIRGTMTADHLGQWQETWKVGTIQATPVLSFTVSAAPAPATPPAPTPPAETRTIIGGPDGQAVPGFFDTILTRVKTDFAGGFPAWPWPWYVWAALGGAALLLFQQRRKRR